jgi:hypothetical protein
MEKADHKRSSDTGRFRDILVSRLMGNSSRPGAWAVITTLALTTIATLAFVAALVVAPTIRADNDDEITTFTVDVAQIGSTNAQNDVDPSEGQSTFTRGDTFIIDGTVYPAGTIPSGKGDPDPNVQPIGKYRFRGTYTGSPTTVPIVAFASELFSLPDDDTSILTDGVWPNEQFAAHRVVLGGTGRFRYVVGEVYEENIGLNKDGFCNLRVRFRLTKASGHHDH